MQPPAQLSKLKKQCFFTNLRFGKKYRLRFPKLENFFPIFTIKKMSFSSLKKKCRKKFKIC